MRLLKPFPIEVVVSDFGMEESLPRSLGLVLFNGVPDAVDLVADESIEALLAEVRLRKDLSLWSIAFLDSAARAALAAVGRLSREAADSLAKRKSVIQSYRVTSNLQRDIRGKWNTSM